MIDVKKILQATTVVTVIALAVKGLGGFHLVVDAENQTAVAALRERKHREEKPLAVMSHDLAAVRAVAPFGVVAAGVGQPRELAAGQILRVDFKRLVVIPGVASLLAAVAEFDLCLLLVSGRSVILSARE